jgi:hypothetical protein
LGSKNPKLDIYWNLHQNLWSVRDRGRVVLHRSALIAEDVKLVVQPAGRYKVLSTGRKNVHAFVRASSIILQDPYSFVPPSDANRVRYNPYLFDHFVDLNGQKVDFAKYVFMMPDGRCYAK